MYSQRGIYSPMTLSPVILAASPTAVQDRWKEVHDIQARLQVAQEAHGSLEASLDTAKAKDEDNAANAVRAAKPIPKSIETDAREALHQKAREIQALETLADQTERAFMETLRDAQPELLNIFSAGSDRLIDSVLADLADMADAVNDLAVFLGTWTWLRGDMNSAVTPLRVGVSMNGTTQDIPAVLSWLAADLAKQSPDAITRREVERHAEWNREMGLRQIVPGVLADTAGFREIHQ